MTYVYIYFLRNFALLTFAAGTRRRLAAFISAQAAQQAAQLMKAVDVQPSAMQQVEAFPLDLKAGHMNLTFDGAVMG